MMFKQAAEKLKKQSGLLILFTFIMIAGSVSGQITIGGDLEEIDYAEPAKYEIGGIKVTGINYLDNRDRV